MVTTPDRGRRFIAILTNELYALAVGAAVSHAELHARAFCGGGGGGVTRSPADLHTTRLPADSLLLTVRGLLSELARPRDRSLASSLARAQFKDKLSLNCPPARPAVTARRAPLTHLPSDRLPSWRRHVIN